MLSLFSYLWKPKSAQLRSIYLDSGFSLVFKPVDGEGARGVFGVTLRVAQNYTGPKIMVLV